MRVCDMDLGYLPNTLTHVPKPLFRIRNVPIAARTGRQGCHVCSGVASISCLWPRWSVVGPSYAGRLSVKPSLPS